MNAKTPPTAGEGEGGAEDYAMLCQCHCGKPCPLGKTGSSVRCDMAEVALALGCDPRDAGARLEAWQAEEIPRIEARFRQEFPAGVRIKLTESPR